MIEDTLYNKIENKLQNIFKDKNLNIQLQKTRKEFKGDITLVVFPLTHISKKSPQQTAQELGDYLKKKMEDIVDFNVVQGFLNLTIHASYWKSEFKKIYAMSEYGVSVKKSKETYILEYSSPNTNKPIHLGHLRNNFLGYSVSEIIKASGKNVKKVQIINDRGIHICKSMLAWKDYGNGETPESSAIKGDHLVGKYYVEFDKRYKKEIADLVASGVEKEKAEKQAPIFKKAQEMLIKWEEKDKDVRSLWRTMNGWVYDGFAVTYKRLGVDFDKNYYESETYLLGKEVVESGLEKGVFYRKKDGSVWIDLTSEGLDHKILLRSDGTAVYMTQDIGTAIERYKDFEFSHMIYTVANEQDYHFKVLFLILDKLGYQWAKNCYHLSYGMVDLPSGRMKSREGTVVDADDFMQEMVDSAKDVAKELGKLEGLTKEEADNLYEIIGLGALKYFLLKVDAKKQMLFNPEESIDFNGNTGPFIQYAYVRIQSILRKNHKKIILDLNIDLHQKEKDLIKYIMEFPSTIDVAASSYNPSLIANYTYELVKKYNAYYQEIPILNAKSDKISNFRLALSKKVAEVIKSSMKMLGIDMPERM